MQVTTITTKGQVTIPEPVRRALGIDVGDKAVFSDVRPEKGEVVLRVISQDAVAALAGSLKTSVPYTDHAKVREAVGKALGRRYDKS